MAVERRRYCTHYVKNEQFDYEKGLGEGGKPINHTAGNQFHRRRVRPGDYVYDVTLKDGQLFLIGRMQVEKIVSYREAEKLLRYEPYPAKEHLLARRGTGTPQHFDLEIPRALARRLRFRTPEGGIRPMQFDAKGRPDRQTLRVVRELTPVAARHLERLLAMKV